MNLNLFAGLYRIKSFLEQIEPQQAGLDLFNLKKTRTTPLVLISFWPQLKDTSNKRSSDEHNKIDRGGESSSKRRKEWCKSRFFLLLYITHKKQFTIPFLCLLNSWKKNVLEQTIYHLRLFSPYTLSYMLKKWRFRYVMYL